MKTESRTGLTEFSDNVDAAFDLIDQVMTEPSFDALSGGMFRAKERATTLEDGKVIRESVSFEVVLPSKTGTEIPEMERVLVEA